MSERGKNRDASERVAKRILDHRAQQGGAMPSATQASREAAEVARTADAQKEAGALRNPNRGRARKSDAEPKESRRPSGRIFIDQGKK